MSIPLIQKPEKDDINTSIIAIKRNIERINMLLGLVDSGSPDLSGFVKKSDIVDVVESGNNNPVTSNAVANRVDKLAYNNYNNDQNNPIDVLSIILTMPLGNVSNLRIGGFCTNSPIGTGNYDFFYTVYKLPERNDFVQVIAYDVRADCSYTCSYINGSWTNWIVLQSEFIDYTPATAGTIVIDFQAATYKCGVINLVMRFANYATPTTINDGDVIGTVKVGLRPLVGVPINVHNFATNLDHLIWLQPDGTLVIYGIGTVTNYYDFYINVTYVV